MTPLPANVQAALTNQGPDTDNVKSLRILKLAGILLINSRR